MVDFNNAIELARRTYRAIAKLSPLQRKRLGLDDVLADAAQFLINAGYDPEDIAIY